jgi:hypothetical protein
LPIWRRQLTGPESWDVTAPCPCGDHAAATTIHAPAHDVTPHGIRCSKISGRDCEGSAQTACSIPADHSKKMALGTTPDGPRAAAWAPAAALGSPGHVRVTVGGSGDTAPDDKPALARSVDSAARHASATSAGLPHDMHRRNTVPADASAETTARNPSADNAAAEDAWNKNQRNARRLDSTPILRHAAVGPREVLSSRKVKSRRGAFTPLRDAFQISPPLLPYSFAADSTTPTP